MVKQLAEAINEAAVVTRNGLGRIQRQRLETQGLAALMQSNGAIANMSCNDLETYIL
jgi:hypothetical protein